MILHARNLLAQCLDGCIVLNVDFPDVSDLACRPAKDIRHLLIRQAVSDQPRGIGAADIMKMLPAPVRMADVEPVAHCVETMTEAVSTPGIADTIDQNC